MLFHVVRRDENTLTKEKQCLSLLFDSIPPPLHLLTHQEGSFSLSSCFLHCVHYYFMSMSLHFHIFHPLSMLFVVNPLLYYEKERVQRRLHGFVFGSRLSSLLHCSEE